MIDGREDLAFANRIVIKAGTSVVTTPDGFPSLIRMANIVENAARLVRQGKEVLIVTSGAVGNGRQRLSKQTILQRSMSDLITRRDGAPSVVGGSGEQGKATYNSACAAAGQLGLMSLYETMFNQFDVTVSQMLVTSFDFTSPERRRNIQYVLSQLLALGIVPLINENDAVSANQGYETFGKTFSDNDSLASLVSIEMSASLLILLTDVAGVYDRPPTENGAKLMDIFCEDSSFEAGEKSARGRGGMTAKVAAALNTVKNGVKAVVIASGHEINVIEDVLQGQKVGTIFLQNQSPSDGSSSSNDSSSSNQSGTTPLNAVNEKEMNSSQHIESIAAECRIGNRQLQSLDPSIRTQILLEIAKSIERNEENILEINQVDVELAKSSKLSLSSIKRLTLSKEKIKTLIDGIRIIADSLDPINQVIGRTEISNDLILDKTTCPIGVILIIFESRPDCLPQIAALAIKSGNGLLLKGGKEAEQSNSFLHSLIIQAIREVSNGQINEHVISLVSSRNEVKSLLQCDQYIDLIIPRGSNELVSFIKSNTRIPVLGHADGVCHVYIDDSVDWNKAIRISIDSKVDYPSACNAAECLLIHSSHMESGLADKITRSLRANGVQLFGGNRAIAAGLAEQTVADYHCEYGDLKMSIEVVDSMDEAIGHINKHGSGHTEVIITENSTNAEIFLKQVDSACVFHNASTRFADGYRFGLGAEVGISTGRIHARGPMGVEGLLTTKWLLRSNDIDGHIVSEFNSKAIETLNQTKKCVYTHKKLK